MDYTVLCSTKECPFPGSTGHEHTFTVVICALLVCFMYAIYVHTKNRTVLSNCTIVKGEWVADQ